MSKKKPLSKQIGYWDNAQDNSEKQQVKNTIGEIKRCLNKNLELQKLIHNGELELHIRGSIAKNTDITLASDLDLHLTFEKGELKQWKNYIGKVLVDHFGKEKVKRKNISFTVEPSNNRVTSDVIVTVKDKKEKDRINALSDKENKPIPFYPKVDELNINMLNAKYAGNYSKMVRTYKGLKNEMFNNESYKFEREITSFMIECLLYNVNHDLYDINKYKSEESNEMKYRKMFLDIKAAIFSSQLKSYEEGIKFNEINNKKILFNDEKKWLGARAFFVNINLYLKKEYDINK